MLGVALEVGGAAKGGSPGHILPMEIWHSFAVTIIAATLNAPSVVRSVSPDSAHFRACAVTRGKLWDSHPNSLWRCSTYTS